jgi:L-iditol 2-dehydrogenase
VKAIRFAAPIPTYLVTLAAGRISPALTVGPHACTRYAEMESPALPGDDWVRIRTRLGGICGSDLGIVALDASPSSSPFSSFPFVLGHENVGTIMEAGRAARGAAEGQRVVVNPLLCCEPRAIRPVCDACATGMHSRCIHFTDGVLPPGLFIGTTRSLGGSWGEEFVAHASQLVPVPDSMSDEEAVLVEPLACCIHAMRAAGTDAGPSSRVAVIGAGSMGLLLTYALAQLARSEVTVVARHPFQAELASGLGAHRTFIARGDYLGALAELAGTRLLPAIIGRPAGVGGFDATYVCVSSVRAMEDALRCTRAGGTIVLIGNASTLRGLDWTPLWLKELTIRGTLAYGVHGHGGAAGHAFVEAADLIARGPAPVGSLVTHTFPLADHRRALETARAKGAERSVKVAFRF